MTFDLKIRTIGKQIKKISDFLVMRYKFGLVYKFKLYNERMWDRHGVVVITLDR